MLSIGHRGAGEAETNLELVGSVHELRFCVQVRLPVLQERPLLLTAEVCSLQQLQDGMTYARGALISAEADAASCSSLHAACILPADARLESRPCCLRWQSQGSVCLSSRGTCHH